jgi:hypothetical protein
LLARSERRKIHTLSEESEAPAHVRRILSMAFHAVKKGDKRWELCKIHP